MTVTHPTSDSFHIGKGCLLPFCELQSKVALMPELPEFSTLTHEQKDDLIRDLHRRLSGNEARLSKDSHNPRKPTSSDGMAKKPKFIAPYQQSLDR